MKVIVLGLRGIPDVQGGVETHAQNLYPHLVKLGCDIEVIVRTNFVPSGRTSFGDVQLRRIWSPSTPGLEALLHSILAVVYAGIARPDILHIHAVGPAIVTPLARLFGLRVVVTHHGPDYDRDKWGSIARRVLRAGERVGMSLSHRRIAISRVISTLIREKYQRDSTLIPNGVAPTKLSHGTDRLARFGLKPGRYFLQVSRIVPEKRQKDLLAAYESLASTGWQLALVGGLGRDSYSQDIKASADKVPGVVLTGFCSGEDLHQIYAHAGAFVLPSSHEGLPIAMLEALSYGLPVIASSIPANLEVGLADDCYFRVGDVASLAAKLRKATERIEHSDARIARRNLVLAEYNWERIAEQTLAVYRSALVDQAPSVTP